MNIKILSLVFPLFFFSAITLSAQDTIYLDKSGKEISHKEEASDYEVLIRDAENPDRVISRGFYDNGQLRYEFPYSSYKEKTAHGTYRTWFENGQLRSEKNFVNGKSHGFFKTYYENGQKKREDIYKKGKLKEGTIWNEDGNEVSWYPTEERPEFPGGKKALLKYLQENAKKPKEVQSGRVLVGFVIDVDGTVVDITIKETTSIGLNFPAYELVAKMPKWSPGKQDGKPVRVKYSLPLNFR